MNLPDLFRRSDRSVRIASGQVTVEEPRAGGRRHRSIVLQPGTTALLLSANEFSALRDFPSTCGWYLLRDAGRAGGIRVACIGAASGRRHVMAEAHPGSAEDVVPIDLDWPLWAAEEPFALEFEQQGATPTILAVGPLVNVRAKLLQAMRGRGVEVGPGLNPTVLPGAPGVEIEYVEEKHPSEWQDVYGKGAASLNNLTPEVLARYRVGSGTSLEEWDAGSLDFIFSGHVIEHLMNPAQVLVNWFGRLRTGGVLAGAIPDARYTFDLRQAYSSVAEFEEEKRRGGFDVPDSKYQRWCDYTSGQDNMASLKERRYAIHVHYYTPAVFRSLCGLIGKENLDYTLFINTVTNNKDFGFVVKKLR